MVRRPALAREPDKRRFKDGQGFMDGEKKYYCEEIQVDFEKEAPTPSESAQVSSDNASAVRRAHGGNRRCISRSRQRAD